MLSGTFEVAIERDRRDAFVSVSRAYVDGTLSPMYHGRVPPVVPLRLTRPDGRDVYVGCLATRPHSQQKMKVLCSRALATDLGMGDGDIVSCAPVTRAPHATKVLVAPVSVDDSEVVEQNAMRIEMELLQQVQVVFPGQIITVVVYAGAHATVRVEKIECGEGNELAEGGGCAVMFEGTHFVVATRMRSAEANNDGASSSTRCTWGLIRGRPCTDAERAQIESAAVSGKQRKGIVDAATQFLVVDAGTAGRFGWTEEGLFQVVDTAALVELEDGKVTPSFLRSDKVILAKVLIAAPAAVDEAVETAGVVFLSQATNLLVIPTSEQEWSAAASPSADGDKNEEENGKSKAAAGKGVEEATEGGGEHFPTLAELEAVHGTVPGQLLDYLNYAFRQTGAAATHGARDMVHLSHNILVCGGKGYGKSTIVGGVLHHLRSRVHHVVLECVNGKNFLANLRNTLLECFLCAPAVLVLDGFDKIAPAQKDGNVQAMSASTKATLDAVLTTFTRVFSFSPQGGKVVILGTCNNREDVNEAFTSAWCFQKFVCVNALTRTTRCALLTQLFPEAGKGEVNKMAAHMDNYTPFDVRQIAVRIQNAASSPGAAPLPDLAETVAASFTPLAHAGIKFLKGDKLNWDSIGGLADAKKVLFDTLVLPLRHPKLFAKLPLKTRSGILLYGGSGCGKTFVLESLVKAENINCIVVNGPEVFGKYIGQSEQKIRDVFERAQAAAPCVVFFDEFDSVAPQRGVDNSGVTDRVVNQLLCYLDGVEGRKDVYVVAASSRPDLIDAALLRPGRLDKAVQCPVPSYEDRVAILRNLLDGTPAAAGLPASIVEKVAAETEHWTPADLSAVVSTANMLVNQRIMERLSSSAAAGSSALRLGEEDTASYFIAGVGTGTSRDKVVDALKVLRSTGAGATHTALVNETKMEEEDLLQAMSTTRPSLSAKDIEKQRRIHALFSKNEPIPVPRPGTVLTTS